MGCGADCVLIVLDGVSEDFAVSTSTSASGGVEKLVEDSVVEVGEAQETKARASIRYILVRTVPRLARRRLWEESVKNFGISIIYRLMMDNEYEE